jgi:glycosyltransferase involved in cell wall biosynthesis
MMITVFTPTYNRAHLLHDVYDSLLKQTFTDFEWVVVDDGSKDDTPAVMQRFLDEGKINIRFFSQQNGGKHRAINHGVKEAKGELFFILDSDDVLPSNALERVNHYYSQIKDDDSFAGVSGVRVYDNGKRIGGETSFTVLDCSYADLSMKYHIYGDMAEVYRTEIMKEFPFPSFENERFCPEGLVWNRIATKYKLRYFNEGIYICEYLTGGLTDRITKVRMESPMASMTYYSELILLDIPFVQKIKGAINYWRFRFCSKHCEHKPKICGGWLWTAPIGLLMHLKDLRR